MIKFLETISLRRIYSVLFVACLRIAGRKITIGEGTIISPYASCIPGNGKIEIGRNCYIAPWVVLNSYGGHIHIGDNVSVNYFSVLYGHGGLNIGNDCRIAAHTVIVPTEHNYQKRDVLIRKQGNSHQGIHIGNDVWIAANVTVLDGSKIENGCVIGANSTVRGVADSGCVYVGSPAKKIKEREG